MLPDLSTADGRAELERAIETLAGLGEADPVRRAAKLRLQLSPDMAAAALSQSELRSRARAKFGAAAETMYFTRAGLEQASRAEVADHRARRFAGAGVASVLDLCCGIGGDALAFHRAGLSVTGIEQDAETALLCTANLAGTPSRIIRGVAEQSSWQQAESVFCDPARRDSHGRVFDPNGYSPPWNFVLALLADSRFAAVKLAPGLHHDLVPAGVEAEWVSWSGGVKEAVLWSGGSGHRATVLSPASPASPVNPDEPAKITAAELTDLDPAEPAVGKIGDYIFEPDGAVIRAGLVKQAAAVLPGGRRIDEHLAYLSADQPTATPLAVGFEVLDVIAYSVERLRLELRKREVGVIEIKKRGIDIDPAALRKELKPSGPNSLTVLLARVGERRLAILAHRLSRV